MQYTYLFQFVLINKKQRRSEKFPSAIIPPPLNYNIAYIKSLIPRQPPWGQKEPQHDHPPIWPQVHSVQNGRRLFAHWAKQPDTINLTFSANIMKLREEFREINKFQSWVCVFKITSRLAPVRLFQTVLRLALTRIFQQQKICVISLLRHRV